MVTLWRLSIYQDKVSASSPLWTTDLNTDRSGPRTESLSVYSAPLSARPTQVSVCIKCKLVCALQHYKVASVQLHAASPLPLNLLHGAEPSRS
jgi:hypothetical protein